MKIDDLFQVVEDRAKAIQSCWTAQLLSKGSDKCAEKFGEEAIEIIIEAAKNKAGLIREAADLLYHFVVMLHSNGVKLSDITDELESRKSKSGIEEKNLASHNKYIGLVKYNFLNYLSHLREFPDRLLI